MNSTKFLSVFMCCFIDFPKAGKDCSTRNSSQCVVCPLKGGYFSGESVNDYDSVGHVICIIIWVITLLVGTLGIVGNFFIIKVLRLRKGDKPFDLLLTILGGVDTLCCVMATLAATACVTYFQNWDGRGQFSMYFMYLTCCTMLLCRSASLFTTVLITLHSYLIIAFPVQSMSWFTARKTKLVASAMLVLSICLSFPRYSSMYITPNPYTGENGGLDIPSLRNFTNIIESTSLNYFWNITLKRAHYQIDTWTPLPLLILFNFLSFWSVHKMSKRKREITQNQKQIQAIKMFPPVVIVLCVSQVGSVLFNFLVAFMRINYRELYVMHCLSVALNSSVNFPIYYFRASNFRREAQAILSGFSTVQKFWKLSPTSQRQTGESKNENQSTSI